MSISTLAPQLAVFREDRPISVRNLGTVDIPQGLLVLLDTANQLGATSPGIETFAQNLSFSVCLPAIGAHASAPALGWLASTAKARGDLAELVCHGTVPVIAAGTITASTLLALNCSSGRLGWACEAGTGDYAIGMALTDAADGAAFMMRLWGAAWLVP
ncbi:MAG: hypothetical protein ABJB12_03850 [Pseudomonadota bacterium]